MATKTLLLLCLVALFRPFWAVPLPAAGIVFFIVKFLRLVVGMTWFGLEGTI